MPGWEAVQKGGVVVCWRQWQRRSIDMEGALGGLVGTRYLCIFGGICSSEGANSTHGR